MALFSRTTKDTKKAGKAAPASTQKPARTEKEVQTAAVPAMKNTYAHVLSSPRITEKATFASAQGVYVFDVATGANKKEIASAIYAVYKVRPRMVRIVNIRPKTVRNMRTGKSGTKKGGKKAYVYLKQGETITIS